MRRALVWAMLAAALATLASVLVLYRRSGKPVLLPPAILDPTSAVPTLRAVSYAYTERTAHDVRNLEFFLRHGLYNASDVHFYLVVNGERCTPCDSISPEILPPERIFYRTNTGYDFGAHGFLVERLERTGQLSRYRYLFLINSSVRGPFVPRYWRDRRWTEVFETLLTDRVGGVASSLVCLPREDRGGPGPRLEGYAVALTQEAVQVARRAGVFRNRGGKFGAIVHGEYGLSKALLDAGMQIDTLMSKYYKPFGAEPAIPNCNRHAHASRHNAVDGIDLHPYEVLFVKTQWQQSYLHTLIYSNWMDRHGEEDLGEPPLHHHFLMEENIHPPRTLTECPWRIGTKRLVVVDWRRPASEAERANIQHFLGHLHPTGHVDVVLNVHDNEVMQMVTHSGVWRLPNVQVLFHARSMPPPLCMHGWTVLRLNSRALQYSTIVFLTERARGPLGGINSGLQWVDRYGDEMQRRQLSLLSGSLRGRLGDASQSVTALRLSEHCFAVDHVGVHFLLWASTCGTREPGEPPPPEAIATRALSRAVALSSMEQHAPRMADANALRMPAVQAFLTADPAQHLGRANLLSMAFVELAADHMPSATVEADVMALMEEANQQREMRA
ncbi:hypothetical protein CDCA_CDCA13G3687 [Cyanidium caldarium]|uniref:Uncharacterized protein n=1 Tax=Cyanidium caldarium TaxID=2771 RepID=A0AAV9IZ96_CYACA|nr:hypothetical protein CDCA_CDCA13G3687 [Cyanidium caldarium]